MIPENMTPLAFPIGAPELIIILVIVLLLFGGSRLAGLGKSSGRALKEFKEETKGLRASDKPEAAPGTTGAVVAPPPPVGDGYTAPAPQTPGQVPPGPVDPTAPEVRRDV